MYLDSTALKMTQSNSVAVGMTLAEVTAILGKPSHTQTIATGESAVLWYATDGVISVGFGTDGRVSSVSAVPSGRLDMMQRRLGL